MRKLNNKSTFIVVLLIIILILTVKFNSPFAFVKDGFLTKTKVDEYEHQFDLGATNRHDENIEKAYLLYLGFESVNIQCDTVKQTTEIRCIFPFLYEWDLFKDESAYRITIGDSKYYFSTTSV